jgi:hypothetical protein
LPDCPITRRLITWSPDYYMMNMGYNIAIQGGSANCNADEEIVGIQLEADNIYNSRKY